MIKFPSKDKNLMVEQGKLLDDTNREFIRSILPGNGKKVESTRHAIISGPQGVGKTYGTIDEANKRNVKFVMIKPGMTDAELKYTMIGLGYNYYAHENVKFMLHYNMVTNESAKGLSGFTKDIKDNVLTLRMQYKF